MTPAWILKLPPEQQSEAEFDYEERAALFEYHGNMSRQEAERRASDLVAKKWGICE